VEESCAWGTRAKLPCIAATSKKGGPAHSEAFDWLETRAQNKLYWWESGSFPTGRSLVSFTSFILSNTSEIKNGKTPAIYHMAGD